MKSLMKIETDTPIVVSRIRQHTKGRLLLIFCTFISALSIVRAAEPIRLACVGDSITAGYGLANPGKDSYPAQLGRLLGGGWEVRNFGVSGAAMMHSGDMPYDKQKAHAEALSWKPDIVVIALGTNDTKDWNIGSHPGDFVPSYRALIKRFRKANPSVKIFLCLPPPAFPEAMGIRDSVLDKEILPKIRQIAKGKNLPLIDFHEPLKNSGAEFPDKIHPNPDGASAIAAIVYGEVVPATQPAAKSLDPSRNTAVIPVPSLEQDSYNWWARHAECLALGPKLDPQVVLIGDSITNFWGGEPRARIANGPESWAATFRARRVLNLGFGWDRTQNVLWRLEHGELDGLHPTLVIINIGTNNFSGTAHARAGTPEEIAQGVLKIREAVLAKCPQAHILIMAVFPRGNNAADGRRPGILSLNRILAKSLADLPQTTFLDIGNRFLDGHGNISSEILPDGTHPSEQGYAIWSRALVESGLLPQS
jgi:lysophospholipase L1-like esterase